MSLNLRMTLTTSLATTSWTKSFAEITFKLSAQLLSEIPPLATCFRHATRRHNPGTVKQLRSESGSSGRMVGDPEVIQNGRQSGSVPDDGQPLPYRLGKV